MLKGDDNKWGMLQQLNVYADAADPIQNETTRAILEVLNMGVTYEGESTSGTWTIVIDTEAEVPEAYAGYFPTGWDYVFPNGDDYSFNFKAKDEAGNYSSYKAFAFAIENEMPDTEAPELEQATLTLDEDGQLVLTVKASDNVGLESLEVDHNLGKHSSTPKEAQLPEFRVPTESIGEVTFELNDQTINAGSVDYVDGKWTITFNDDIVAVMKNLALEYQDGTIKFYLVVRDLAGNESGSMYDGTYEVVDYTWEEPVDEEDTFILSYPSEATLPDGHPEPDGCEDATFVAGGDVNLEAGNWYFTAVTAKKNVEGAIANLQFQIDGVPNDAFDIHMYDFEGEKWYTNPPVWGSGFTAEDEPYNDGVTTYIFIEAKAEGNGSINIVLKDIVAEKTLSNTLVGAVRVTKAISDEE